MRGAVPHPKPALTISHQHPPPGKHSPHQGFSISTLWRHNSYYEFRVPSFWMEPGQETGHPTNDLEENVFLLPSGKRGKQGKGLPNGPLVWIWS